MKILNLYAGLGGNRRLWSGHEITAVEIRPDIAQVYRDQFPDDEVVVGNAHDYLLKNYQRFDFIWSSPPCPSHSRSSFWAYRNKAFPKRYPDMSLYQEIIFLQNYFDGLFTVENVNPYYQPVIAPAAKIGRHLFWSNFRIPAIDIQEANVTDDSTKKLESFHQFNLSDYSFHSRRDTILRNCVPAEIGLHILESALGKEKSFSNQLEIF